MAQQVLEKMVYPERMKWLNQQLINGKELGDILDLKTRPYQQKAVQDWKGRVNTEAVGQWEDFTSSRTEKAEDLFCMALWEFMANHK